MFSGVEWLLPRGDKPGGGCGGVKTEMSVEEDIDSFVLILQTSISGDIGSNADPVDSFVILVLDELKTLLLSWYRDIQIKD
ncbi:hypothetical protein PPL_00562 [Heterostelium album PN500]|uniref:Uncharacterized protein n=1 Tax=Heterostelium pallidum (strain ATCC 26659 / Pp 5 / PN500) TaxID=670386 RepID=D3AWT4_HETP5|nr:hypothetical protein PPL_00562 [Heterostelium album PN500]EFA86757.1 hypothetical protein PPL_00562 [Heterostelium album PN500]|eukprot:XP_020438861.1 hypothetical protein PPL_00562 [Heterostelium album PN500]